MAAHCLLGFLALLCCFPLLHSAADENEFPEECPKPFTCGNLGDIHFPFTFTNVDSECSLDIMGCLDPDPGATKKVLLKNQSFYEIESIHQEGEFNSISIYDNPENPLSSRNGRATVIPPKSSMMNFHVLNSITFYRCIHNYNKDKAHKNMYLFKTCSAPDYPFDIYYSSERYIPITDGNFPSFPSACSVVQQRIGQLHSLTDPCVFFTSFLEIEVNLSKSCLECYVANGGQCSPDMKKKQCFDPNVQPDKEHNYGPPPAKEHNGRDLKKVKIIGLSFGLAGMTIIACFAILLLYKRRHNSSGYQNRPRNIYSGPYSNTNPESGTVYFGIPVFSYEELQEATNNFDQARELGEGGFGTVYYGMLRDGREVAVKRLYERNYRLVETFINEIQILTRLRHRNLVSLYGCTSRHSRELLLVYEYIPNGTVSYHLHGDKAKPGSLPWPVRMKIAIETASALTYLHASDIIHRDVKTSNILLDNNFCVKVADFGLSRLFPNDVTHVSTAPRGTPGYVDPDYRICYQLTSKSDVYSFGVVLVELISSLPAVDMSRDRDEIKLANLAIRKIQKRAFCEFVDPSLGFQSDDKLKRMITSVAELAFQCLQGDKELRPSMGEVLEKLQRIESGNDEPGNLEGIDVHGARVSHSYAHPALPNTLLKPERLHQTL